jgi:putative spermidine/putrescine transport system substrate-binding protein
VHAQMVRRLGIAAVSGALAVGLAACGSSSNNTASDTPTAPVGSSPASMPASSAPATTNWSTAQSAAAGGGMSALVAAANAEGKLNVVALPRTWANWGTILDDFSKKYPQIKIHSENPDGSSQDEITAIEKGKGQPTAPDVVDVGNAYAYSGALNGDFAAYKVATWDDIPAAQKDAGGLWWMDYGGYMSIGCNQTFLKSKGLQCPTTIKQLDNPGFKGLVALNGDPTEANAAFMAVWAASLANGGSATNIQPGIDFFKKLNGEGIFNKTSVTPATVASGATPIVMDWDYLQLANTAALKQKGIDWVVNDPSDGLVSGYYTQAINSSAPDPAAARLFEEFLYAHIADGGQNGWLGGFARPVEFDSMTKDGTINKKEASALPKVTGNTSFAPTQAQITAAQKVVASNWAAAVS